MENGGAPSEDVGADSLASFLQQLTAMQAQLADLSKNLALQEPFGADIPFNEDDSSSGEDLVDDLFTDSDEHSDWSHESYAQQDSGDQSRSHETSHTPSDASLPWLVDFCHRRARGSSSLDADQILREIREAVCSSSTDEELQMSLLDLLGYEDLEDVSKIIQGRQAFRDALLQDSSLSRKVPAIPQQQHHAVDGLMTKDERREILIQNSKRPLFSGVKKVFEQEQYPHVYGASSGLALNMYGTKYSLPEGSVREEHDYYEEISVPPARTVPPMLGEEPKRLDTLDTLCANTFKGYTALNRIQSLVFPVAYRTNENMLICAPTGAGKTDVAMLTILQAIATHCTPNPHTHPTAEAYEVAKDDFKIVYVAPMKALAAEIVEKFSMKLRWLGISCRELTGDMQLTKFEIQQTQIIVTTPEKWDVVTRKGMTSDVELVQKVRLLIFDEVHMLHDERGSVIESLVARTLRYVEASQSMVRISTLR